MRPFKIARQKITRNEYCRLHQRVRKILGKASYCSNKKCQRKDAKRFEWALKKDRPYSENPSDYFSLCQSCHRRYDVTPETRAKLAKSSTGNTNRKAVFVKVYQYDLSGNHINTFPTIRAASIKTGVTRSSIWMAMIGEYKQAKNFLWSKTPLKSNKIIENNQLTYE